MENSLIKIEELLGKYEQEFIDKIPSEDSTSREEKIILMQDIIKSKPKIIVETGTHRGLTTCYLALVAKEMGAVVHTYDPYDYGANGNFEKFPELPIVYHQQPGRSCDLESIDFFFCDGYHEKIHVIEELDTILPKLTDGAIVYFHDTNGSNALCDVPGGIDHHGLKVEYLKTLNGMAKYVHNKNIGSDSDNQTTVPQPNV